MVESGQFHLSKPEMPFQRAPMKPHNNWIPISENIPNIVHNLIHTKVKTEDPVIVTIYPPTPPPSLRERATVFLNKMLRRERGRVNYLDEPEGIDVRLSEIYEIDDRRNKGEKLTTLDQVKLSGASALFAMNSVLYPKQDEPKKSNNLNS